jgi:hypothetical protein
MQQRHWYPSKGSSGMSSYHNIFLLNCCKLAVITGQVQWISESAPTIGNTLQGLLVQYPGRSRVQSINMVALYPKLPQML